jgi:hypothetical protein
MSGTPNYEPASDRSGIAFKPSAAVRTKTTRVAVGLSNNVCGEYQTRVCCVLGVRGSMVRKDRATAQALTQALLESTEWTANNPAEAAAIFSVHAPQADVAQLTAMLKSHTDHHHPVGDAFIAPACNPHGLR